MEENKEIILEQDILDLNAEVNKYQKEIFKILLKISKSFSVKKTTKQDRDEMFEKVDELKLKVKECNKKIREKNNIIIEENRDVASNLEIKEKDDIKSEEKSSGLDKDLEKFESNIKKIESINEEIKNKDENNECKIIPLVFKDNQKSDDYNEKNNQLMVIEKENKSIISKIFKKIKAFFIK